MKKKVFFLLTSLFFSGAFSSPLDLEKDFYEDDPWGFIGKKFYDEPLENYNTLKKQVFRILVTLGGGLPSAGLTYKITKKITETAANKREESKKEKKAEAKSESAVVSEPTKKLTHTKKNINKSNLMRFVLASVAFCGGSVVSYGLLNAEMKRRVDYHALKSFMENWGTYKKFVPIELLPVLKKVHVLYVKKGWSSVKKYTQPIIVGVRKKLARNDDCYGALYKINEDFFEAKHFVLMLEVNVYDLLKMLGFLFLATQGRGG